MSPVAQKLRALVSSEVEEKKLENLTIFASTVPLKILGIGWVSEEKYRYQVFLRGPYSQKLSNFPIFF